MAAKFYVYRLFDDAGTKYIGKGSGRRLETQKRNKALGGEILAYFFKEQHAYDFEVEKIAELKPSLNMHPGGNGSRAQRLPVEKKPKWLIEMDKIGSRVYAARALLRFDYPFTSSELERLRSVAHGQRV